MIAYYQDNKRFVYQILEIPKGPMLHAHYLNKSTLLLVKQTPYLK